MPTCNNLKHEQITVGEAIDLIQTLTREDLRPCDLVEFDDINGDLPSTNDIFRYLLSAHIGLVSLGTVVFLSTLNGKPCFIATRTHTKDGDRLCGFGWRWAADELTGRQKWMIASKTWERLIDYPAKPASCVVRRNNREVIEQWLRLKAKSLPGKVKITPTENGDYVLVEVNS